MNIDESTPLLVESSLESSAAEPSGPDSILSESIVQFHWKPLLTLALIYLLYILSIGGWWAGLYTLGFAHHSLSSTDAQVLSHVRPSGDSAWEVVKQLASNPHPYNSNDNLRIRSLLMDHVSAIAQQFGDCPILEMVSDNINMTMQKEGQRVFYESNNVLVRVSGKSPSAFLVSSHYDSVSTSHGVTDDGIAVGSMLSVLKTIMGRACTHPLEYSLIFLFNNAEEVGLYGGYAMLEHPWFVHIKGFINLEGSGAAMQERPQLFRTNTDVIVSMFSRIVPYPHMSVTTNQVMKWIPSDTDYRPFVAVGGLQGIDVAFSSYRYLYHTERDDLDHGSAIAAQHMCDNAFGVVMEMVGPAKALDRLEFGPLVANPLNATLPVPDFFFYDIMGYQGLYASKLTALVSQGLLFLVTFGVLVLTWRNVYKNNGALRKLLIRDWRRAYFTIWISFFVALFGCIGLSVLKSLVNSGTSYGNVEVNFLWYFTSILTFFALSAMVIKSVLRKPLDTSDSEWINQLEVGLCGFWLTMLLISLLLTLADVNLLYFIAFPIVATLSSLFITRSVDIGLTRLSHHTLWHARSKHALFLVLAVVPSLFLNMDLYRALFVSLPSMVTDGLTDVSLDGLMIFLMLFGLINTIPLIHSTQSTRLAIYFGGVSLIPFLFALFVFPYGPDRPLKISLTQTLELDGATAKLLVADGMTASQFMKKIQLPKEWNVSCFNQTCLFQKWRMPSSFKQDGLIDAHWTVSKQDDSFIINGQVTGSQGSRVCILQFQNSSHTLIDPQSPDKFSDILQSRRLGSGSTNETSVLVMRREFEFDTNERIVIPFESTVHANGSVKLNVSCAHTWDLPDMAIFRSLMPDWVVLANIANKSDMVGKYQTRHGSLFVKRSFEVLLALDG